ncbi:MAG: NAD(+)/NADH kinase [bacterium]|nr:NAD(+)/NADH kinase [bacterium]
MNSSQIAEDTTETTAPRCFGMYTRRATPVIEEAMARTRALLQRSGIEVVDLQSILSGTNVEVLLAFGGDGTMLHAVRLMAPLSIPVLGINFGHVGYLCAIKENDIETALQLVIDSKYSIESRTMLQGDVYHDGELVWQSRAFNDFQVGGCNRTVTLEITINGHAFGKVRGDGVIIATKTGSTAYAFSAGGPALLIDAISLVSSNAVFSSAIRSLVLPTNAHLRIRNLTEIARPYVIADGQKDFLIGHNTELQVTASTCPALLVNLGLISEVETLHRGFQEVMLRELDSN